MKIILKQLSLTNFKGIRSMSIDFDHVTNIYGNNATGKTSLMDAFLWLFFGKDSSDRKDFEIKTLDEKNEPYHRLDHEVTAVILADGEEITIRRTLREKWETPRGSKDPLFKGHTTAFFWNDVPMKESEYQAKVSGLLNENIFKLITNTSYFNSLKWQDRRAVLLQLAGKINDSDVIAALCKKNGPEQYEDLIHALNSKTVEEYKREIAAKKKKLKDELVLLPSRIEEAGRALPDEKDYSSIDALIESVTTDIDHVDGLLMNKSKATKEHQETVNALLNKKQTLSRQLMDMEFTFKNELQTSRQERTKKILGEKNELSLLNDKLTVTRKDYLNAETRKNLLVKEQSTLREQWSKKDAETIQFKEGEFCCPTCKRDFEASDIESRKQQLTNNFNTEKSKKLNEITERGKAIAVEVSDLEVKMNNLKADGEKLNIDIAAASERICNLEQENERLSQGEQEQLATKLETDASYLKLKKEVAALDEQINAPYTGEDNSALQQRKRELNAQLDELKATVATKGQREKQLARIAELQDQEAKMAQELASLEGIEFSIDQFTKAKMDEMESRINGRFQIVRFKMFEAQINGGEVEACTTLINGVPYADANTAAKIQAGLDIINVLSEHYDVQAPVWVDNRESVVALPETDCQLINLFVSASHKKLTVGNREAMEMA